MAKPTAAANAAAGSALNPVSLPDGAVSAAGSAADDAAFRTAYANTTAGSPRGAVTPDQFAAWQSEFDRNRVYRLMQNAVTFTHVDDLAIRRDVITSTPHSFSHRIDDWPVTNQKRSGRCWMFAGLNLFRVGAMKKMNLGDFEFSQNYTLFWDKIERSNYFLEAIIETADRSVDDRTVRFLLAHPIEDGGQWQMFVNVVRKHGVAPKTAMPETESSSNTFRMNAVLLSILREGAKTLRDLKGQGAPVEALRTSKQEILKTVYRVLCIHLGTPPAEFDWQWTDRDRCFRREGRMTPQEFAEEYVTAPIDDYVCLVHDPRESSPSGRTYTVQYLNNTVGGPIVKYLNVDLDTLKRAAMHSIVEHCEPVWMGCDVGKMMRRDLGVWDANLYDYEGVYDVRFGLSKADRLVYHQTQMTHAMLFTGVDAVDGWPRRWRVENSWGDQDAQKGFFTMNDSWFDEHVFEIVTRKSWLPESLRQAYEQDPIVLPPWDPMGSLAE